MEGAAVTSKSPESRKRNGATRTILDQEEKELQKRRREAYRQFGRGKKIAIGGIKDKKLRTKLKSLENKVKGIIVMNMIH